MNTNFELIKEFHRVFGRNPDPVVPTVTDIESRKLRAKLMFEEFEELLDELGLQINFELIPAEDGIEDDIMRFEIVFDEIPNHKVDLAKVAKETSDLLYVTYGTGASMGLPIDDVYQAVHNSNMSKMGPDGKAIRREDGKILKGPNYKEPDVKSIIERI